MPPACVSVCVRWQVERGGVDACGLAVHVDETEMRARCRTGRRAGARARPGAAKSQLLEHMLLLLRGLIMPANPATGDDKAVVQHV